MATVASGGDIDINDVFESDITLAAPATPGTLHYHLERPNGTLAADWVFNTDPEIVDKGNNQYHAEFRVDMPGIWYWDWKPDGVGQEAFVQGWFRVVPALIGNRTP